MKTDSVCASFGMVLRGRKRRAETEDIRGKRKKCGKNTFFLFVYLCACGLHSMSVFVFLINGCLLFQGLFIFFVNWYCCHSTMDRWQLMMMLKCIFFIKWDVFSNLALYIIWSGYMYYTWFHLFCLTFRIVIITWVPW